MDFKIVNGLLILKLSLIQSVALAIVVYYLGVAIRKRVPVFVKHSIPPPVVGGLLFAGIATFLRMNNIIAIDLDSTMQTNLMIMFFTTMGMAASVSLVKRGGIPLVMFWVAGCVLGILQNFLGIFLAKLTGIHALFGIIAGAVTLMGGLGTAGAFGPMFEEWGISGATAAAIACATFGMVAGSLMGGPVGERMIKFYKIATPKAQGAEMDASVMSSEKEETASGSTLMATLAYVLAAMGIGAVVSFFLTKNGITLPLYMGGMIMGAVIRNIGDVTKKFEINTDALEMISNISLGIYLTMAINGLKLWELVHLAIPLLVILVAQCVLMLIFCWLIIFLLMGRDYEAMMLSVGMIGFGMGATPNALANMQTLGWRHGPAPKAWLIVSIVGAFLIDFTNAITITIMGNMFR